MYDAIISNFDTPGPNESGPVPNGRVVTHFYVSQNCCVGGDELGGFEVGFAAPVGEFPETGYEPVFGSILAFHLGADHVEFLPNRSVHRPCKLLSHRTDGFK